MLDLTQTYEVVIFSIGDTKAGTKMGKLQLKNLADDSVLNCILWEEALNRIDGKVFRTGNHVKILGGSYNEKYNNCLVTSVELVKEAKLGLDKDERDKLFNGIVEYANEIEDEELKKYVTELLFEHEEQFKIAPAARLMHHNYLGGLVEHTFECLEIAKCLINNLYKKVDKQASTLLAYCMISAKFLNIKLIPNQVLSNMTKNSQKSGSLTRNGAFQTVWLTDLKPLQK